MSFDYSRILKFGEKILSIPSPTGFTHNAVEFLLGECKKRNVSAFKDVNGNLIATIPGKTDYTVGLAAHCDTLGAMVKYINGDGTLKFSRLGSPILPTYDGEYCTIHTRSGKVYNGKVVKVEDFGCFVEILPGKEGLCHISKLSRARVEKVSDVVSEGQQIPVKLLEVDKQGRLNLSYIDAIEEK